MKNENQFLYISWETIFRVSGAILIFYLIYLVRDIILWFFFAFIISVLLEPAVKFLRKLYFPKVLAVATVYLLIFGFLGFLIYLIAPIFVIELKEFIKQIPDYFEKINPLLRELGVDVAYSFEDFIKDLIINAEKGTKGVISALSTFFGGAAAAIFILSLSFFLSLEEGGVERMILLLTPKRYEELALKIFEKTQEKIAKWFGARIIACLFVGIASFAVFIIFDIKYAFLLSLIAGVLNFVFYIGPWITGILLVVFITVSHSLIVALYTLLAFIVIQAMEGHILTPLLVKKMINLPPALVLLSLLIGGKIFGFLGLIFAIPVSGIIYEFLKDFLHKSKLKEEIEEKDLRD